MKILCCCNKGRVRSVAIKQRLKKSGHECLSVRLFCVSDSTLEMLVRWADEIVVADECFMQQGEPLDKLAATQERQSRTSVRVRTNGTTRFIPISARPSSMNRGTTTTNRVQPAFHLERARRWQTRLN